MASPATLDDAVTELKKLVSLVSLGNSVAIATRALIETKGLRSGGGGRPPREPHSPKERERKERKREKPRGHDRGMFGRIARFADIGRRIGSRISGGAGKTAASGRAAGARMGAVGGVAGGAVAAVGLVVVAFLEARKAVEKWTDAAMNEAKRLSAVSGGMAAVTAQREIQQMRRDMIKGEATAGTAQGLMQAESRRKDQENRIEIVADNVTNAILTGLNQMFADIMKPIADAVEFIAKKLGLEGQKVQPSGLTSTMKGIMDAQAAIDKAGYDLMGKAHDAARHGGIIAPMGALPRGRVGL